MVDLGLFFETFGRFRCDVGIVGVAFDEELKGGCVEGSGGAEGGDYEACLVGGRCGEELERDVFVCL